MKITFHIPLYNDDPTRLLQTLSDQRTCSISGKIIIWDDGSDKSHLTRLHLLKKKFEDCDFIIWHHHPVNLGRAAVRQRILEGSESGWNISIDADMIPDQDFTAQLRTHLTDPAVIYQGRHYYQSHLPPIPYRLHWKYGTKREIQPRHPSSFFTGIFGWHHSAQPLLHFDPELQHYGHEDTLFRWHLDRHAIPVKSIPARALHDGLMDRSIFLKKQKEAVQNLILLLRKYPRLENNLIRYALKIEKYSFLKKLITGPKIERWCIRELHRKNPPLIFLDLLKLNWFLENR